MKSHWDSPLLDEEINELNWAHTHLEHPSFAARLSGVVGVPIEKTLKLLPQSWDHAIHVGAGKSIERAARVAIMTLGDKDPAQSRQAEHLGLAALAGALGGLAGPLGLLVELPVMTVLMLRSIAGVAHAHGEDLETADARTACVEVFGLGARSRDDDAAETGYFGLRSALAFHFGGALGSSGMSAKHLPGGMNFLLGIASRFGLVVSDQIAARMLPVAGALSGSTLNLIFMRHFQDVAKGHFIVRRLERKYGADVVRIAYGEIGRRSQYSDREYSPLEGW